MYKNPALHTQNSHVVFALLLVLLDQVVKVVCEVLEELVLLVNLQPQDAIQELGDAAVCGKRRRKTTTTHISKWETNATDELLTELMSCSNSTFLSTDPKARLLTKDAHIHHAKFHV